MTNGLWYRSGTADALIEQLDRLGVEASSAEHGLAVRVDLGATYPHSLLVWTPEADPTSEWRWSLTRHEAGVELHADFRLAARRRVPAHVVARLVASTLPAGERSSSVATSERVGS